MRTVHVLNKWTAVVSRDLANVRAFSSAPCTLARLSNSTEKVVWVEHTSTNSFREKKKAPSLNKRFLSTWLHQLFTHATRISSKQSRPPSQPGQRTLKIKGKFVRARSEKSTRGVVSNCAACVSNDVKENHLFQDANVIGEGDVRVRATPPHKATRRALMAAVLAPSQQLCVCGSPVHRCALSLVVFAG